MDDASKHAFRFKGQVHDHSSNHGITHDIRRRLELHTCERASTMIGLEVLKENLVWRRGKVII
jgi:hypothetical protein